MYQRLMHLQCPSLKAEIFTVEMQVSACTGREKEAMVQDWVNALMELLVIHVKAVLHLAMYLLIHSRCQKLLVEMRHRRVLLQGSAAYDT